MGLHRLVFRNDITIWREGERHKLRSRAHMPSEHWRGVIARMHQVGYDQTSDLHGVILEDFVRKTGVNPKTFNQALVLLASLGVCLRAETADRGGEPAARMTA